MFKVSNTMYYNKGFNLEHGSLCFLNEQYDYMDNSCKAPSENMLCWTMPSSFESLQNYNLLVWIGFSNFESQPSSLLQEVYYPVLLLSYLNLYEKLVLVQDLL